MSVDRAAIEAILARQIPATDQLRAVDIPSLGGKVWVKPLDGEARAKIMGYASSQVAVVDITALSEADRDELASDAAAKAFIGAVRHGLVDEDGQPIVRSYAEAAHIMKLLDPAEFVELNKALQPDRSIGSVEEGKDS